MTVMSGPRVVPCVVFLSVVSFAAAALAAGTETLRFADNFDTFDLRKWKHEITMGGGGNWEFQLYHNSRQNSFVKDGVLHLKPTYTADLIGEDKLRSGFRMDMWGQQPPELCTGNAFWGCERTSTPQNILNPIASARVRTAESFTFKYGRVEVRARLPKGDWLWPAIWLLPADNSYGLWPASGEIDIMESRGNVNGPAGFGVDSSSSTLHWGPDFNTNSFRLTQKVQSLPSGQTFNDGFHTFGLYWDENKLFTYIDDESNVVLSVDFKKQSFWDRASESTPGWAKAAKFNPWVGRNNSAPFDSEFYLIMNLAVGGTMGYWSDAPSKPWNDKGGVAPREFWDAKAQWSQTWDPDKSTLAVDSVKIWTFPNSDFHYPRGKMTIPEETEGGGSSQR